MPRQLARWETEPPLPLFSPDGGRSQRVRPFTSRLAPTPLPPPAARLPPEPEWAALLAPWDAWDITEAVKIRGSALQRAMTGWRWWRYNPEEPDDPPDDWTLFLAVEDPRRGLAWAAYGWVID